MALTFEQLNPGPCRAYLLGSEGSPEVVLIDPVLDELDAYLERLQRDGLHLSHVLDTHCHADHISAGARLADDIGCEYVMHRNAVPRCASKTLEDGARLRFGGVDIEVLHTPGHTRDSVSLVVGDRLLTGDALFLDDGGAGRDDLPGGDPGEHWDSLQKLRGLPDHLVVHPGHEYRDRPPSTLGQQKSSNPHLKSRSREHFVAYLEELQLGPADWMKEVLKANAACARELTAAWIPQGVSACEVRGTLSAGARERDVDTVSAQDLHRELQGDAPPVLIDVREAVELDGPLGHLDGVVHVPIKSMEGRMDELTELRERPIVTVCKSGGRARTAAQMLEEAGFRSVRVLVGGMQGWHHAGLESAKA